MKNPITKNKLREYLKSKASSRSIAGKTCESDSCPLANCLKYLGYIKPSVGSNMSFVVGKNYKVSTIHLNDWQNTFRIKVDSLWIYKDKTKVTVGECLEILDRI